MSRLDPSLIRGLDLFRSLDDRTLASILDHAATRRVAKGATLFEQGAEATEFFVILDGRFKVHQVTPHGDQVLLRFVGPGELCGVAVALGRPDYPGTASAVVDSLVLAWKSVAWEALCRLAPVLAANALHTVGRRLLEAHSRIREFSTEEVQRRLAHALLRLAGQAGKREDGGAVLIDFPITRQDLADMTGTTLHTVSRIMSAWESEGLVDGGRQRVLLRDPHRLLLVAEGRAPA